MKDLDFDELDKAVNSLMGNVPKSEPVKPDDDIKTLVIKPSQPMPLLNPVTSVVPYSSVSEAPTPSSLSMPDTTSVTTPSLATRRAGRFMDVVHPSSDMTKTATPVVSRSGGVIEPLHDIAPDTSSTVLEAPVISQASEPVVKMLPPITSAEGESDVTAHAVSDWPDPLDLHDTQPVDESSIDDESESEPEPQATDETSMPDPLADPAPLTSPFLPDAKVEKRPLGGFASETVVPAMDEMTPVGDDIPAADEPVAAPVAPTAELAPLPEELQSDLMAIESRQADTSMPVAAPEAPSINTPKPALVQPAGPSSISQQYKEEPSTGEQTNGAIYDTDSYHKPLEHPAKKKSSWTWIIWIVVLLVIGVGGGAAAYLFLLK